MKQDGRRMAIYGYLTIVTLPAGMLWQGVLMLASERSIWITILSFYPQRVSPTWFNVDQANTRPFLRCHLSSLGLRTVLRNKRVEKIAIGVAIHDDGLALGKTMPGAPRSCRLARLAHGQPMLLPGLSLLRLGRLARWLHFDWSFDVLSCTQPRFAPNHTCERGLWI